MTQEILMKKEIADEKKLMDAIHRQAKDAYYMEKGKRYLEEIKAKKKEAREQKIIEFVLSSLLLLSVSALWLFALINYD